MASVTQHDHRSPARGASLLEFALVFPLLALLAVGIADLSASWRLKQVVTQAAREGARVASVTPSLQNNDARVVRIVDDVVQRGGVPLGQYTRFVRFASRGAGQPIQPGDAVTVTVIHRGLAVSETALSPLWPTFQIQGESTMRYEMRTDAVGGASLPTPPPAPCDCTEWTMQGCGQGGCDAAQAFETRLCRPHECGPVQQCRTTTACAPPPGPSSASLPFSSTVPPAASPAAPGVRGA